MKFGLRTPSLKRRIAARTSWKRYVRNNMGLKAPRGFGIVTNPKRALYNRVYNRTSFNVDKLFKTSKNSSSHNLTTTNKSGVSGSFFLNLIIFLVLAVFFFPFAIIFLVYKLYKSGKSKSATSSSSAQNQIQSDNKLSIIHNSNNDLVAQFHIPEPTKSLLWITDEDISKIQSSMSIQITFNLANSTIDEKDGHNFYGEPSLIWTKLPITPNDDLETEKMYYPSYSHLFPQNRFQYLKWLTDVTQDTNLSYVFLYYYGLERHLLIGNYDAAVDEILRLIKCHDKGTFKGYAITALILASGYRKRPDIVTKAPFVLEEFSPVSLYMQKLAGRSLTAKDIIAFASRVGFSNRRYINLYSDLFEIELQSALDDYQVKNGDILQSVDINKLPNDSWASMANTSLPDNIRTIKFPSILEDPVLKSSLKQLLEETHLKIKEDKNRKI